MENNEIEMGLAKSGNKILLCGTLASLIFTFSWIIQEAFRPGYNPLMIPISSLAIGNLGWTQSLTFLITGGLLLLFAYGLWKSNKPIKHNKSKKSKKNSKNENDIETNDINSLSKWALILIAICGIGLIGAGCFTTDPLNGYPEGNPAVSDNQSINSIMHQLFSSLLFFGVPIACFLFGNYFTHKKELKWLIYSFLSGILFLLLFLVTSMGFSQVGGLQNYSGLLQRITLTIGFLWIAAISIYFFNNN